MAAIRFAGGRSSLNNVSKSLGSLLFPVRGTAPSVVPLTTERALSSGDVSTTKRDDEPVTHTGQVFQPNDYRKVRFVDHHKLVNTRFAIDLIREDPVVVCTHRVVSSDSGGALGHPKVYINLDPPGVHVCGYSGRKFVLKKHYDEKTMGPSISYSEYLRQIGQEEDD